MGCIEGLNQFFQSKEGETHIVSAGRGVGGGSGTGDEEFLGEKGKKVQSKK